jgi:predicted RNA binding protein YcfA (HicA-like mRNA interferase family)
MVGVLLKLGFVVRRQRGSHVRLKHPETRANTTVPVHANRPLSPDVLSSIMADAGLTDDDLRRLLGRR